MGFHLVQAKHLPAHQLLLLLAGFDFVGELGELSVALLVGGVEAIDTPQNTNCFIQLAFFNKDFRLPE